MPDRIAAFLATKTPQECALLLENAPAYISNPELLALMRNFHTHNHKKNMKFKNQLLMLTAVPGLKEQVDAWMRS